MDDLWLNAWAQHFGGQYRMGWNVREALHDKVNNNDYNLRARATHMSVKIGKR